MNLSLFCFAVRFVPMNPREIDICLQCSCPHGKISAPILLTKTLTDCEQTSRSTFVCYTEAETRSVLNLFR